MTTISISQTVAASGETLYTLRNGRDMRLSLSDRGASLISWWAPDRYGRVADVLLGYRDTHGYRTNPAYFGATIGRCANRIARGRFSLDGSTYLLECNDGNHHLHGGPSGFSLAQWAGQIEEDGVRFTLASAEGEGGYPGNVQVQVRYRLDDEGRLTIEYGARTDAPTPLNLTAHPYFNLNGGSADIGDHLLSIDADLFLKIDDGLIPVGAASVAGSAFDFREPAPIGPRLAWPDLQLALAGGFDHCYCLRPADAARDGLREVASVFDPGSGRTLSVATTEPGLQFYSGNFLAGVEGRGAQSYARHDGFCLEAQHYPNQINGPDAEALVLRPGQVYRQTTVYRLGVRE